MNPVVKAVLSKLGVKEGVGDKVTTVKTGMYGVTDMARRAVGARIDWPDRYVAECYLNLLYDKWKLLKGFLQAPVEFQVELLDNSYNLGPQVMSWKGVVEGFKEGNYRRVAFSFLSSANVGGMSVRGLAKRRAEVYNALFKRGIVQVEQLEDGTLNYIDSWGSVVFSYKAKNGRHPKSAVGSLRVC